MPRGMVLVRDATMPMSPSASVVYIVPSLMVFGSSLVSSGN